MDDRHCQAFQRCCLVQDKSLVEHACVDPLLVASCGVGQQIYPDAVKAVGDSPVMQSTIALDQLKRLLDSVQFRFGGTSEGAYPESVNISTR
jgi:hypothetical protein